MGTSLVWTPLVPPRDAHALAEAVNRMLDDALLRRELAHTALRQVVDEWSWPVAAARICAAYEEVRSAWPTRTSPTKPVADSSDEPATDLSGQYRPAVTAHMRAAVAVSPHLDDAVFSAGGVLALLSRAGWHVRVITCFTASVDHPGPFALSTQLDKGLPADVDYTAVRRAEDCAAQQRLGLLPPIHLPLPEAPHRGYNSARELFTPPHADDTVAAELQGLLQPHLLPADLVLAPQALGDHVDHVITAQAVAAEAPASRTVWWRDMPYTARLTPPESGSSRGDRNGTREVACDIGTVIGELRHRATRLSSDSSSAAQTKPSTHSSKPPVPRPSEWARHTSTARHCSPGITPVDCLRSPTGPELMTRGGQPRADC
ncbi:PIG-L family deacetylase [Streptomyces sp. NPDC054874]